MVVLMGRMKKGDNRTGFFYLALVLLGLVIINYYFKVFSGLGIFFIATASLLSMYLHVLQNSFRKSVAGQFIAGLSAVYNPLALTVLIMLTDYQSVVWLLLFLVNMLRNPYLGFVPSILNGIVSVACFDFLAVKIYHLDIFEIVFGSLVFFTASVLAWGLTLRIWVFEQQSIRDGLTGLRNRRSFNLALKQEIWQCLQSDRPISLLMLDLDNFKKYNDTLGHVRGDQVLKEMATLMAASTRDSDLVFRYGGEEFCVLLPGVGPEGAEKIAERIREQVEEAFTGHEVPVTVSIGISTSNVEIQDARYLVELADRAMYRAKILKNRVIAS